MLMDSASELLLPSPGVDGRQSMQDNASSATRQNKTPQIHGCWVAMLLFLAASSSAQEVSPQPATPEDEIRLFWILPALSCFNEVADFTMAVDGPVVSVDVLVDEVEAPICPTPPPLVLDIALGNFAPGSYELILSGLIRDEPFGPVSVDFEVLLGNSATAVTTLNTIGHWLMLLLLAFAGMRFLSTKP